MPYCLAMHDMRRKHELTKMTSKVDMCQQLRMSILEISTDYSFILDILDFMNIGICIEHPIEHVHIQNKLT